MNDYILKYKAVRFLNRFLINETANIHDNLGLIEECQILKQ